MRVLINAFYCSQSLGLSLGERKVAQRQEGSEPSSFSRGIHSRVEFY
jgi:hypothetical protein